MRVERDADGITVTVTDTDTTPHTTLDMGLERAIALRADLGAAINAMYAERDASVLDGSSSTCTRCGGGIHRERRLDGRVWCNDCGHVYAAGGGGGE